MAFVKKTTRAWCSPERYIQGPGELRNIELYSRKLGRRVVAIIDEFFFESLTKELTSIFSDTESEIATIVYNTEVTEQTIVSTAKEAKAHMPDVIIGIGGGKAIDVAKAVAYDLGLPVMIVPTLASTDAPTSSLSVIYDENGTHCGERFYEESPKILIVDSEIIAQAPVRFLISGMGDALATLIEAKANRNSDSPNLVYFKDGGFRRTIAGTYIAQACYKTLLAKGKMAKIAAEQRVVTEALEDIIETNILLSGLGFENNNTAGAHSVADGLTAVPGAASKSMHGEKVAFGTICQLIVENAPTETINEVLGFCFEVGLPITLEDLYVANTDENIALIAEASMHSNWKNEPFVVNKEMVAAAIKAADALGRAYKAASSKN
ncbi:MAG: glycerol dehydrogenase [Christensenellaceae bacterium]